MAESVVWGAMGALVLLAVVVRGLGLIRARLNPTKNAWDGAIVGAVVQIDKPATALSPPSPAIAWVVIRRPEFPQEDVLFVGDADQLPMRVKNQLGPITESIQAPLSQPVPVTVLENQRGELDWQLRSLP